MSSHRTKRRKFQHSVQQIFNEINSEFVDFEPTSFVDVICNEISNDLGEIENNCVDEICSGVGQTPSNSNDIVEDYFNETVVFDNPTGEFNLIDYVNNVTESEISSESESETSSVPVNFKDKLAVWAVKHNITGVAVDDLLSILSLNFQNLCLPKTHISLLQTPRSSDFNIISIPGGIYYHFGLKKYLVTQKYNNIQSDEIVLMLGIDGVPVYKSSKKQFWPILGKLDKLINCTPFLIALYLGDTKPLDLEKYLNPTILELEELLQTGIFVAEKHFKFKLSCVIADAPARSMLKQIIGHGGYYACERCEVKGIHVGKVVYPDINSPLRSDDSFRCKKQISHHTGNSEFLRLNFGMVSQFPLDYLHLVCLGVCKKMLVIWTKGPIPHKLSRQQVDIISGRLCELRPYFPSEFSRKPRSLAELSYWKGTQFRNFLLYSGPLVLRDILTENKYKHFLLFSKSIRILLNNDSSWYNLARQMLRLFVGEFGKLYSKEFITYNLHSLIHLPDDADKYGSLERTSAFCFENYMQELKRMLRGKSNPLQQVIGRVEEGQKFSAKINKVPEIPKLKSNTRDCHVMLSNGSIAKIVQINSVNNMIEIRKFMYKEPYFLYPIDSTKIHLYVVRRISNVSEFICKSKIARKCILLPTEEFGFVCYPHNGTY